eukprot:6652155-Pyramimonas_sp.AAC.1
MSRQQNSRARLQGCNTLSPQPGQGNTRGPRGSRQVFLRHFLKERIGDQRGVVLPAAILAGQDGLRARERVARRTESGDARRQGPVTPFE